MDNIGIAILWFDFLKTRVLGSCNQSKSNEAAIMLDPKRRIENEFVNDIEALCKYDPELKTWIDAPVKSDEPYELTIGLKDIFGICPRSRQRTDRYKKLCAYLSETFNVVLTIKSQKSHA